MHNSKKLKTSTILNATLLIDDYYKKIESSIDIEAEEILQTINSNNQQFSKDLEKKINLDRSQLIDKLENLKNNTINEYNSRTNTEKSRVDSIISDKFSQLQATCQDEELINIKREIFTHYCFYINLANLNLYTLETCRFGLLVCTDWFVTENQEKALKYI